MCRCKCTLSRMPVLQKAQYIHTFVPKGNLMQPVHLLACFLLSIAAFGLVPPRALCGAPLWRLRGPVGLPFSSRRLIFPGGAPLKSGLVAVRRSGLSLKRGLSPPPRSIPLHTAGGTPAREYGPDGGTEMDR